MSTNDTRGTYNIIPSDESTILAQAEHILRSRLERLGTIEEPSDASAFLRMRMAGLKNEHFDIVLLDNKHRILDVQTLALGTIDSASIHPREAVRAAIEANAAAVIFAHNHPSGDPTPSGADRAITKRLRDALALIEVRVLDHIVVGADGCVSMMERGLM